MIISPIMLNPRSVENVDRRLMQKCFIGAKTLVQCACMQVVVLVEGGSSLVQLEGSAGPSPASWAAQGGRPRAGK